jgi:hypothetical protein
VEEKDEKPIPLVSTLCSVLSDLLFYPGFTVNALPNNSVGVLE